MEPGPVEHRRLHSEAFRDHSGGRSAVNETLTFIALASGAATLAVWLFSVGREFDFSLERAVRVMVATCPHALGLAIPLDAVAIVHLARATYRKILQNLAWAAGYNAFAIRLALQLVRT